MVAMGAGKLKLNYHEQHTEVWGDAARDHGVSGSQVEFARDTAEEMRRKADELQLMLEGPVAPGGGLEAAIRDLLATVYDMLAALKVAGTPV
jgi:hypothetical protein